MEISFRHWFSVLSIAVLIHLYAALNVNLTGFTAESRHSFDQYTVDLTTLSLPPKQLKLEPFKPPPKKAPVPEAKPVPKPKPQPKPVPPKIVTPKVEKPKVVRPELEKPVQATQVTPVETRSSEAQQPAPQPSVQQPARTSTAKPSASHRPAPRPGSQTAKPGYYKLILERLERLKKYPSRARRRGQQGTVVLSFTLNRDGSLKHYRITQSSGAKSLDLEVKKLILRATPFPAIPKNISSDTLEVSVPISFSLQ